MSVTDPPTADQAAPPAPPAAANPDATYGWPTWVRRSIIAVVLVACAALLVWGNHRSIAGKPPKSLDPAVVKQTPPPGGTDLRQATVGAYLQPGYDGRLIINGISIPEAQMVGARDPATVDAKDLQQNGLRPNNRNTVLFTPGPGKVITKLPEGTVYVILRYFPERRPNAGSRTVTWSFTAV